MHRIMCLSAAALALLALIACGPAESQNPLSDPQEVKADPRLTGLWAGIMDEDKGEQQYILFAPKLDGTTDFVLVMTGPKDGADVLHFEFFPTRLDGVDYMNLRTKTSDDPLSGDYQLSQTYNIARYEFDEDGMLSIWYMDDEEVKSAIGEGRLEGADDGGLTITSSTPKLVEFIKDSDHERLFDLLGHFEKVNVELPRPE